MESSLGSAHHHSNQLSRQTTTMMRNQKILTPFGYLKLFKKLAGIDTKANVTLTLHEQLLVFFTTKQGQNESDDNYFNHFDSHLNNLELAGGEHLFCSS